MPQHFLRFRPNILHFLLAFALLVAGLYGVKSCYPRVLQWRWSMLWEGERLKDTKKVDSVRRNSARVDSLLRRRRPALPLGNRVEKSRYSPFQTVNDYLEAFPDLNNVQLFTAQRIGVPKCADRAEAMRKTQQLVFIGASPYYKLASNMGHSIPYLVPRAAALLEEIGRAFVDSLACKGLPFHQLRVTSVLRTEADVARLRKHNSNASSQSCHCFGTTFDIAYHRYHRVQDPSLPPQPETNGGRLKQVLAEVLRDQRRLGTCYVKYEVRQACFHITAR